MTIMSMRKREESEMASKRSGGRRYLISGCIAAAALGLTAAESARAVDWSGVPEKEVMLFYPGQGSWEWVLTKDDHSGAPKFREGKNCYACHKTEEKDMGAKIVSGKKLEPHPIAGKPGSLSLKVKTAHDGDRLYFRFQWQGGKPTGKVIDKKFAERVTVMIDDGHVKEAARAGCWGTCHDDVKGMASAPAGKEIKKYLIATRTKVTRQGGGENFKSAAEIDALRNQGVFMEYWQARMNPGKPVDVSDGYILEKRHKNDKPVVGAEASYANGTWTVVLSRKLKAGGGVHKDIVPGKTYNIGFAVHDDHVDHRYHHVSFERTLVLDSGTADFVAAKK
jgi:hypothetical protein